MNDAMTMQQRRTKWTERNAHTCPVCSAAPEDPCTYGGKPMGTAMHYQRGRKP